MDTALDAAIGAHTAPLVRFGQVNAQSVLNDSVSTPMSQQMGLSNGYAQMPWFLIFSILLALNGLILGHVWIAALSAFVCGLAE